MAPMANKDSPIPNPTAKFNSDSELDFVTFCRVGLAEGIAVGFGDGTNVGSGDGEIVGTGDGAIE